MCPDFQVRTLLKSQSFVSNWFLYCQLTLDSGLVSLNDEYWNCRVLFPSFVGKIYESVLLAIQRKSYARETKLVEEGTFAWMTYSNDKRRGTIQPDIAQKEF